MNLGSNLGRDSQFILISFLFLRTASYLSDPFLQKGVEMKLSRNLDFRHMLLVDFFKEALAFMEALFY